MESGAQLRVGEAAMKGSGWGKGPVVSLGETHNVLGKGAPLMSLLTLVRSVIANTSQSA